MDINTVSVSSYPLINNNHPIAPGAAAIIKIDNSNIININPSNSTESLVRILTKSKKIVPYKTDKIKAKNHKQKCLS